ncbi:MAG TPA: hypothetical protein VF043_21990 [Ktedonobacteraceae bacterium]
MNGRDEEFFSEIIDGREDEASQNGHFAWRRSSGRKFIYSSEKVEKADMQSLDRVWDRMREHVARNSSAYKTNNNLAHFSTGAILPATRKFQSEPKITKRRTFQHRLAMAAAVCFVTLLVGSMLLVLNTFRYTHSITGASNQGRNAPGHPSVVPLFLAGKIAIIQLKGEVKFQTTSLNVPEASAVLWDNQSSKSQVIVRDDKPVKYLSLRAGQQLPSPFLVVGSFSFHLQSNPGTHAAINVFNAIKIVSSRAGNLASFSIPSTKLKVGTTLLWTNTTNQTQAIIGESGNQVVKLQPKSSYKMTLDKPGAYIWHLASNPGAQFSIVVFT